MNHAKDLTVGSKCDFAGLGPEIQLRYEAAIAEIPDSDRAIVVRNCEAATTRIYRNQRRRPSDAKTGLHVA